jgi:hypothetical protein
MDHLHLFTLLYSTLILNLIFKIHVFYFIYSIYFVNLAKLNYSINYFNLATVLIYLILMMKNCCFYHCLINLMIKAFYNYYFIFNSLFHFNCLSIIIIAVIPMIVLVANLSIFKAHFNH